jgi:hypothetical protein
MRTYYGSDDEYRQQPLGPLFAVPEVDPFADSTTEPTADERRVAKLIAPHKGAANPVSIAVIAAATGLGERTVKGLVARLIVTHRMRIGGRREAPVGYFMIESATDLEVAVRPLRNQVIEMWHRLRVLENKHELARLLGQLSLEGD